MAKKPKSQLKPERIAGMATMPSRAVVRAQAVASLLPQVDELWVYLNEHSEVPIDLDSRCTPILGSDKGDVGKFSAVGWTDEHTPETYLFTVDDDLIYPPDYTETLIEALNEQRCGAVGVHSAQFRRSPPRNYYGDRDVRHCLYAAEGFRSEHMLGTGTLLFKADSIALTPEHFENGIMADVWFALAAQQQQVALRSIPRREGWLQLAQPAPTDTLWGRMCIVGDDAQITALGRTENWKLW